MLSTNSSGHSLRQGASRVVEKLRNEHREQRITPHAANSQQTILTERQSHEQPINPHI